MGELLLLHVRHTPWRIYVLRLVFSRGKATLRVDFVFSILSVILGDQERRFPDTEYSEGVQIGRNLSANMIYDAA